MALPLGPIIMAGGMALGGYLGRPRSNDEAIELMKRGVREFEGIQLPTGDQLSYRLQELVQQGIITPKEAQAILLDKSAYEDISVDPTYRAAQLRSLQSLGEIVDEKGLDPETRSQLSKIATQESSAERGSREAILQNAAARGVSGSGLELGSQLINQQESAGRMAQRDLDVAALGRQRALEAIAQQGQLGGQMQGQAFGEQASVAAAKDAIDKFNASNKQNVALTNVAARNAAQEANLRERQRIAEANAGQVNEMARNKANVAQTQYENRLKRAAGMTGQLGQVATQTAADKARQDQYIAQLMGSYANLLGSYDWNKKKPAAGAGG